MKTLTVMVAISLIMSSHGYQLGLLDNVVGGFVGAFTGPDVSGSWFILEILEPTIIHTVNIYLDTTQHVEIHFLNITNDALITSYINITTLFNESGLGYTTLDLQSQLTILDIGIYKVTTYLTGQAWIETAVTGWPFTTPIATLGTNSAFNNYYGLYNWIITSAVPPTTTPTTTTSIPSTTTSTTIPQTTTTTTSSVTSTTIPPTTIIATTNPIISTTVTLIITTIPLTTAITSSTMTTIPLTTTTQSIIVNNQTTDGTQTIVVTDSGTNKTIVDIVVSPEANITIVEVIILPVPVNDTNNIVSVIISITPENNTQPSDTVEITFYNVTNITTSNVGDYCLATLNETSTNWTCVDTCLNVTGNGTVSGGTSHFSTFALLLMPMDTIKDACGNIIRVPVSNWLWLASVIAIGSALGAVLLFGILTMYVPPIMHLVFGSEGYRIELMRKGKKNFTNQSSTELDSTV